MQVDTKDMLQTIENWSNINTGSYHLAGLETFSKVLIESFSILGADQQTLASDNEIKINANGEQEEVRLGPILQFTKRPEAKKQVLLLGHMDTVFAPEHPFQKVYHSDDNTLNGPGVADMKGGLCVILHALKAFESLPIAEQCGWQVIINSDEEIGSMGSGRILAQQAKKAQLGLIYEPSLSPEGLLAGQRKGSGQFIIVMKGRAAHAGRAFNEGRNAITQMAKLIQSIAELNGQRDQVTINMGRIDGGEAINIVAPLAICRIGVRFPNPGDDKWVQQSIEELVAQPAYQTDGFETEVHSLFTRQPKVLEGNLLAVYEWAQQVAKGLDIDLQWQATGGCCDGNNLAAAGLPNIDTLGVRGGGIHSDQEYLLKDSLAERVQLTTALLQSFTEQQEPFSPN